MIQHNCKVKEKLFKHLNYQKTWEMERIELSASRATVFWTVCQAFWQHSHCKKKKDYIVGCHVANKADSSITHNPPFYPIDK